MSPEGPRAPPRGAAPATTATYQAGRLTMTTSSRFRSALLTAVVGAGIFAGAPIARADGNLGNVNHIIIVMMENHSFDNYFGILGYVAGTPYHNAHRRRGCDATDTTC